MLFSPSFLPNHKDSLQRASLLKCFDDVVVESKIPQRVIIAKRPIFITKEKGRDLTQSHDKSPYTNRNVKRAKWQHKQRHKKVRLHSGSGPT